MRHIQPKWLVNSFAKYRLPFLHRSDLDNMGLSERWLAHKPDRTALEQRLLKQMIDKRTPKKVTPPVSSLLSINKKLLSVSKKKRFYS